MLQISGAEKIEDLLDTSEIESDPTWGDLDTSPMSPQEWLQYREEERVMRESPGDMPHKLLQVFDTVSEASGGDGIS